MYNIVLIGMMGSGKTTISRILGRRLGRKVLDTDDIISEESGMTITELFAVEGETGFRDRETALCRRIGTEENLVIATGGGLPLRRENRDALGENSVVVFLMRDPGEIYDQTDMSGRPLGQEGKSAFVERFFQRLPVYEAFSDLVIRDFSDPESTADRIMEELEKWEKN